MFKPSQLGKIVAEGVTAHVEQNKSGVLKSLKEFDNIWNSKECQNYRVNFGKAVGILQNKSYESAGMFNTSWKDFLDSGTYLSAIAVTKNYDSTELLIHLSKINRTISFLQEHEKKIDEAFAKGLT